MLAYIPLHMYLFYHTNPLILTIFALYFMLIDAFQKLEILKEEINSAEDPSDAFSKIAAKVSECPSANRGGNLGTFKPGMVITNTILICLRIST